MLVVEDEPSLVNSHQNLRSRFGRTGASCSLIMAKVTST